MLLGILLSVGGGVLGLLAHRHYSSDARRTRRVLRRTRVTKIADLPDGKLVCIVGRVEAESPLVEGLMSRMPCVAFETVVQVFGGVDMTLPTRVDVTRQHSSFFVIDDTGRVRIDAAEAALANPAIMKSERFEERVIEDGARVRIVGSVVLDPTMQNHPEHAYREGAFKATLTGTRKYPLLIDLED